MKRAGVRDIVLRASDLSDSTLSKVGAILGTVSKSESGLGESRGTSSGPV